jgi:predicted HTH transcriptional regulator
MTLDLETLREGWDFEAKLAAGQDGKGQVPKAFWETYSAMANTHGGVIALGVREESDGRLVVHGLQALDKVERDLWNILANPEKVSCNLLGREDVERHEICGKTILVLQIPRANRRQRPVFINNNPLRGTYVRGHEGDRHASAEAIRRMLSEHFLVGNDKRRWSSYCLVPEVSAVAGANNSQHNEARGSQHNEASSQHKEASSQHKGKSSHHTNTLLQHCDEPQTQVTVSPSVESLPAIVLEIRGQQRSDPAKVVAAICALCQDRYVTAQELAEILHRSMETLKNHYISKLIRQGILEQRFPEQPTHPAQAYRVKVGDKDKTEQS